MLVLKSYKHDHPIYFTSWQLISMEQNYVVIEWIVSMTIFAINFFCHNFLGNKFTIVINHQTFKYLFSKPNFTRIIARWILLFQEYEFTIKDQPRKNHGNVDALLWTYKWVGDQSKDDDFPNAKLFAFDVEKVLKGAYYLLDQKISEGTNN